MTLNLLEMTELVGYLPSYFFNRTLVGTTTDPYQISLAYSSILKPHHQLIQPLHIPDHDPSQV